MLTKLYLNKKYTYAGFVIYEGKKTTMPKCKFIETKEKQFHCNKWVLILFFFFSSDNSNVKKIKISSFTEMSFLTLRW